MQKPDDSLNANYSFKYFGKEQGVAAYTFRDERDLLWYSTVFSAAERESAYVIDGLMHNEVVKSDIHSTDAFGFSELVFAVSHPLGFSYALASMHFDRLELPALIELILLAKNLAQQRHPFSVAKFTPQRFEPIQ